MLQKNRYDIGNTWLENAAAIVNNTILCAAVFRKEMRDPKDLASMSDVGGSSSSPSHSRLHLLGVRASGKPIAVRCGGALGAELTVAADPSPHSWSHKNVPSASGTFL